MNLLMIVALMRSVCYGSVWIGSYWWYSWALGELKRQCLAVQSLGLDTSIRPNPSGRRM